MTSAILQSTTKAAAQVLVRESKNRRIFSAARAAAGPGSTPRTTPRGSFVAASRLGYHIGAFNLPTPGCFCLRFNGRRVMAWPTSSNRARRWGGGKIQKARRRRAAPHGTTTTSQQKLMPCTLAVPSGT
jgi:hypothetical protein